MMYYIYSSFRSQGSYLDIYHSCGCQHRFSGRDLSEVAKSVFIFLGFKHCLLMLNLFELINWSLNPFLCWQDGLKTNVIHFFFLNYRSLRRLDWGTQLYGLHLFNIYWFICHSIVKSTRNFHNSQKNQWASGPHYSHIP